MTPSWGLAQGLDVDGQAASAASDAASSASDVSGTNAGAVASPSAAPVALGAESGSVPSVKDTASSTRTMSTVIIAVAGVTGLVVIAAAVAIAIRMRRRASTYRLNRSVLPTSRAPVNHLAIHVDGGVVTNKQLFPTTSRGMELDV